MTKDYATQLEEAAKMTQKLVKGLTWLEKEGPSEQRLKFLCQDINRLAEEFSRVVEQGRGPIMDGIEVSEADRLRGLYQTVKGLQRNMSETAEHIFLRLHVLDALEKNFEDQ